jgi:hypothetical protein
MVPGQIVQFQLPTGWRPAIVVVGPPYPILRVLITREDAERLETPKHTIDFSWLPVPSYGRVATDDLEIICAKKGDNIGSWREVP